MKQNLILICLFDFLCVLCARRFYKFPEGDGVFIQKRQFKQYRDQIRFQSELSDLIRVLVVALLLKSKPFHADRHRITSDENQINPKRGIQIS
jgi:hypothetical protein